MAFWSVIIPSTRAATCR